MKPCPIGYRLSAQFLGRHPARVRVPTFQPADKRAERYVEITEQEIVFINVVEPVCDVLAQLVIMDRLVDDLYRLLLR